MDKQINVCDVYVIHVYMHVYSHYTCMGIFSLFQVCTSLCVILLCKEHVPFEDEGNKVRFGLTYYFDEYDLTWIPLQVIIVKWVATVYYHSNAVW